MIELPRGFAAELKTCLDIAEVVGRYLPLKRRGSGLFALCPFHSEKTASFGICAKGQFFKCFGCNAAGDAIEFVRKIEGIGFSEAVRLLADRYGVAVETKPGRQRRRLPPPTLAKAARFRVGVIWRIERSLDVLKPELLGPRHDEVASAVRSLTEWRAEIEHWSDYRAATVMVQLRARKLVNAAIQEAAEAERQLAGAIAGAFREGSAAA
jgi:hypothetical protein